MHQAWKVLVYPVHQMLKLWKQLISQSFFTLTLVNMCTVAFNKISYGCKKCTGINFKAPWLSKFSRVSAPFTCAEGGCSSLAPSSTRLPLSQWDSVPATLQFPPATFLQFENPVMIYRAGQKPFSSIRCLSLYKFRGRFRILSMCMLSFIWLLFPFRSARCCSYQMFCFLDSTRPLYTLCCSFLSIDPWKMTLRLCIWQMSKAIEKGFWISS